MFESDNIKRIIFNNPTVPNREVIWLDIANAGKTEIEYLRKNYGFSLSHLSAASPRQTAQRTAIQNGDNYLFMIAHFPVYTAGNIISTEIDFFIGDGYIITLHENKNNALNHFFSLCKKDSASTLSYRFETSAVLLYEILDRLIQDCFSLLDQNAIKISHLEELIYEHKSKKAVSEILALRRNIINTRLIMINHKNIIKKLIDIETGLVPEHRIMKYYNNLLEYSKRFWENLEIQNEMVEVLNSTNESTLNNRLNDIMKTLTLFSVIVFPLTLLAAIFGMNTVNGMPFMNHPQGFWMIIGIMLCGSFIMIIVFAKKKWL